MRFFTDPRFLRALLLGAGVALSGCAHLTTTQSGFLSDYSRLKPAPDKSRQLVFAQPDWKPADYSRVVLEPSVVRLAAKDEKKITPKEAMELTAYCDSALKKAIGAQRTIATEDAPGTLRVRAAVTGVDTSSPALNVVTGVLLWPVDNGGVSLEFEVLDAANKTQLVALVGFSEGTPLQVVGSFSRLGHARSGVDRWVGELKKLIAPPAAPGLAK